MCYALKYGTWIVKEPKMDAVNVLVAGGFPPMVAMVLASRGIDSEQKARQYLACDTVLPDPYMLKDMALAATRIALALDRGEKIAVFGDYDADGIMSTVILYKTLSNLGADVSFYIPDRENEGYGLNYDALQLLKENGTMEG